MKRIIFCLLGLATAARADEIVTVTTPPPTVMRQSDAPDRYELTELHIHTDPPQFSARVRALRADGTCARTVTGDCQIITAPYTGDAAIVLINALNSADLRSNSLRRRVLTRLMADGWLPQGAIAGSAGLPTQTPTATATGTVTATATATVTATESVTATATATSTPADTDTPSP